jgi:septum formation protein
MVRRLAVAKALAVEAADAIVIGSDTAVELDGEILGKPADLADAMRMLRRLSGRLHRVHTAVAVRQGRHVAVDETVSEVTFVQMTDDEISWYVGTGEPLDKAGAYGLQGIGGAFVESVRGSVTGVLGLPLDVVVRLLADLGVDRPAPRD